MSISAVIGKVVGNNKGAVQNFGIVGITITFEELAQFVFFYCPCDYPANQLYGSIFIWGPAVVLFVVGFLAHRRTWRLTTGLCNREQGIGRGGKRIFHFIHTFLAIGMKAVLAPATWVVLAFLKGDYFACAQWPDPNDVIAARELHHLAPKNTSLPRPCMFNSNPLKFDASEQEIIARNLRAKSHVIGWLYLCIALSCGVVVMFMSRCWSRFSYEQGNYIARYRAQEINIFEDKLEEKAKAKAEDVVTQWFSLPRSKLDWDKIAVINDKVTKSKRGRPIYSPLHRFVNKELIANNMQSAVPDLVTDASSGMFHKPAASTKHSTTGVMVPMGVSGGHTTVKTVMPRRPPIEMKEGTFVDNQTSAPGNTGAVAANQVDGNMHSGETRNGDGLLHAPEDTPMAVETPRSEVGEDVRETSIVDDDPADYSSPLLENMNE